VLKELRGEGPPRSACGRRPSRATPPSLYASVLVLKLFRRLRAGRQYRPRIQRVSSTRRPPSPTRRRCAGTLEHRLDVRRRALHPGRAPELRPEFRRRLDVHARHHQPALQSAPHDRAPAPRCLPGPCRTRRSPTAGGPRSPRTSCGAARKYLGRRRTARQADSQLHLALPRGTTCRVRAGAFTPALPALHLPVHPYQAMQTFQLLRPPRQGRPGVPSSSPRRRRPGANPLDLETRVGGLRIARTATYHLARCSTRATTSSSSIEGSLPAVDRVARIKRSALRGRGRDAGAPSLCSVCRHLRQTQSAVIRGEDLAALEAAARVLDQVGECGLPPFLLEESDRCTHLPEPGKRSTSSSVRICSKSLVRDRLRLNFTAPIGYASRSTG